VPLLRSTRVDDLWVANGLDVCDQLAENSAAEIPLPPALLQAAYRIADVFEEQVLIRGVAAFSESARSGAVVAEVKMVDDRNTKNRMAGLVANDRLSLPNSRRDPKFIQDLQYIYKSVDRLYTDTLIELFRRGIFSASFAESRAFKEASETIRGNNGTYVHFYPPRSSTDDPPSYRYRKWKDGEVRCKLHHDHGILIFGIQLDDNGMIASAGAYPRRFQPRSLYVFPGTLGEALSEGAMHASPHFVYMPYESTRVSFVISRTQIPDSVATQPRVHGAELSLERIYGLPAGL
jgi:hypothetical protein